MSRIVELHDRKPLVVKRCAEDGGDLEVCRCGLSAKWPLCDRSHLRTADEPTDRPVTYDRVGELVIRKEAPPQVHAGQLDPRHVRAFSVEADEDPGH